MVDVVIVITLEVLNPFPAKFKGRPRIDKNNELHIRHFASMCQAVTAPFKHL
jgi:hypothetical protein